MTPHLFRDVPLRENVDVPPPSLGRDVWFLVKVSALAFVLLIDVVLMMAW